MRLKRCFAGIFLLLLCGVAAGQARLDVFQSANNLQYGFTVKASLLIDCRRQHLKPYFRIGADAGIASTFLYNWLYPSANLEFQLYNGGLGTRNRDNVNAGSSFEILPAFTLTAGWPNRLRQNVTDDRYISLYYFSNFARPALQNPYLHSISLGSVFSIVTEGNKRSQRIGFLDLNIADGFQFAYYNDGSVPFEQLSLGDAYDRYHTGGGLISYSGPQKTQVNTIELAYHKYTGFTKSTFEASNKLFLAYMDYQDPEQQFYNRSQFDLTIANPFKGYGLQAQYYNSVSLDLQHDIHTAVMDTYHMVPYKPPYVSFGISYYGSTQQTGKP